MDQQAYSLLSCGHSIHIKPYSSKRLLPYYLIRFQAEGASRIGINGVVYEFRPGDLLVASPGDDYRLETGIQQGNKPVRCGDYFISCQVRDATQWFPPDYPRKLHIGLQEPFMNLFKNLLYEKRKLKDQDLEIQDCLVRLLFLFIRRFLQNGTQAETKAYLPNRMKDYIEAHATERLTLKQVASHAGLGISRASQLFKEAFGHSVMDYAIEVRLNTAREYILYTGNSLEEICYNCGFGSYTHFSRMFSGRFGQSPKTYRDNNR